MMRSTRRRIVAASIARSIALHTAGALDEHAVRTVDHHLRDAEISEEWLQRTEPGDFVEQFTEELLVTWLRQQRCLRAQQLRQRAAQHAVDRVHARRALRHALVAGIRQEAQVHPPLDVAVGSGAGIEPGEHAAHETRRSSSAAPPDLIATSSRRVAARSSGSGGRTARTPASTARAIGGRTGTRARTGRSSTSRISAAPSDRPGSSTNATPAARVVSGAFTAAPQAEVAAAQDHDRHVGDLDRHPRRGRIGAAGVDNAGQLGRVAGPPARAAPASAAAAGASRRGVPGGIEGQAGRDLDGETVEGVGRRVRSGGEPFGDPGIRVGAEAEDRGEITTEIGEAAPATTSERGCARGGEDRGTRAPLGRPQGEKHVVPPGTPAVETAETSGEARGKVRAAGNLWPVARVGQGVRTRNLTQTVEQSRTRNGPARGGPEPIRAVLRQPSGVPNLLGHGNPNGDEDQEDDDLLHRISRTGRARGGSARMVSPSVTAWQPPGPLRGATPPEPAGPGGGSR